jgi:hypothetical protein
VVLQGGATGGAAIGRRQCYFQVQAAAGAFPLMPSTLVLQIAVEASLRSANAAASTSWGSSQFCDHQGAPSRRPLHRPLSVARVTRRWWPRWRPSST